MPALLGLFGGTFDPPHIGHLILASEAHAQLGLDRLLWVLTPDPPHKQDQTITPFFHRRAMLELAIADNPWFELSAVDMDRPGPQFALDTVRIISQQNPAAGMVYLMGGDSLHDLPNWHRPVELAAALQLIGVMRRPGDSIDLPALEKIIPGVGAKVRFIQAPLLDIAAHEIRERVSTHHPFRYYLTPTVYDYILKHDLYSGSPPAA
jgi:nicotinate-nucleotide adenylyltransferase